ncbi:hypothetical protein KI387_025908 [Taxus chinensis]|uniref:RRM domain-containing protein n=1 Tax=Taxus chinensis TaxID=29808 RepID=A0AA38FXH1_TAXCH|nr:hypothetical protein KI387_025908 [Taxus chinensis]
MSQMSMVDIKTNVVNSHPHQVERGTLGALGHSEDGVFRKPWRYTLPLWSMSMQRCASWISSGTPELSDSGLGEAFEVATSLEAEFMWEVAKRHDGVILGSKGRNIGELIGIIRDIANKDTDILANIQRLANKDPAHRKIFIRGLGWDTTSGTLKSIFFEYGELEECTIIMDKATAKSKGYDFVTFKDMDAVQIALKEANKKIDSRMTVCQMASISPVPQKLVNELIERKIYVSNVPVDLHSHKLLNFFSKYGEVEEGTLGFDKQSGKSKWFSLFIYKAAEGVKKALEDPNKNIDGYSVHCKRAIDNQKQKNNTQT